jgi:diamine N-acetyltransferase
MDKRNPSLAELVQQLPPEAQPQVREFVEYLLSRPAQQETPGRTPDPGPQANVTLREITADTVREICKLSDTLTPPRKFMVAPNAVSIAQAYFEPKAWMRAIYADDTPVGFLMLYDDAGGQEQEPEYFLWRLMIAGPHQGKGYGQRALALLVDYVKTRPNAQVLETSCGQGPGSPEPFYHKVGFRRNGKMLGKEVGLSLELWAAERASTASR